MVASRSLLIVADDLVLSALFIIARMVEALILLANLKEPLIELKLFDEVELQPTTLRTLERVIF